MSSNLLAQFDGVLKGHGCVVTRHENQWSFTFDPGRIISVSATWRLVGGSGIIFVDTDDGQWFGFREPVDGEAKSNAVLHDHQVVAVEIDRATADIRVVFDRGIRLDVFNNSSGYEGWQAQFPLGDQTVTLVGMGGGDLTFAVHKTSAPPVSMELDWLPRD